MKTVQELRQSGYKVRVIHSRVKAFDWIHARGGATIVELRTPEGVELRAETRCSTKDNYNKKIGVALALSRIFTNL
jgi:hypothetical protein